MKAHWMRFKFDSKKYISLFLVILTIGSTAAYGLVQSFAWGSTTQTQPDMPATPIVDYELTSAQKDYAIRLGRTVLDFRYPL